MVTSKSYLVRLRYFSGLSGILHDDDFFLDIVILQPPHFDVIASWSPGPSKLKKWGSKQKSWQKNVLHDLTY